MAVKKTYNEVFAEIAGSVKVKEGKKGGTSKKQHTFSRSDFDKLTHAWLNTPEHVTQTAAYKGGELVVSEQKVVENLRNGFIRQILIDFGVDAQEADKIATYQFRNVNGIYEMVSEAVYNFMDTGKRFDFLAKPDFVGGVFVDEVAAKTTTHKGIKEEDQGKSFVVEQKAHKALGKKSSVPAWLKNSKKV